MLSLVISQVAAVSLLIINSNDIEDDTEHLEYTHSKVDHHSYILSKIQSERQGLWSLVTKTPLNDTTNNTVVDSNCTNNTTGVVEEPIVEPEPETVTYIAKPSSWSNKMPYRWYRVTVLKELFDYFGFIKNVPERELTNYKTDNDFDATDGSHKEYYKASCSSPSKYILSVEAI
jgi:hypothetical protein